MSRVLVSTIRSSWIELTKIGIIDKGEGFPGNYSIVLFSLIDFLKSRKTRLTYSFKLKIRITTEQRSISRFSMSSTAQHGVNGRYSNSSINTLDKFPQPLKESHPRGAILQIPRRFVSRVSCRRLNYGHVASSFPWGEHFRNATPQQIWRRCWTRFDAKTSKSSRFPKFRSGNRWKWRAKSSYAANIPYKVRFIPLNFALPFTRGVFSLGGGEKVRVL